MSNAVAPNPAPSTTRRPRLRMSPVTRQELADRFRGPRGGIIVTGYVAVLALALLLLYLIMSEVARFNAGASYAAVGRSMFDSFMAIQLAVVMFFGAGYAASQVASEREKRTLPLLQITRLTPFGIVAGKWWAVTAWQVLLLLVGMPLAAAAAFFGGVALVDVVATTLFVIVACGSFSAIAIAVSATLRRTATAIVVTYGLLVGLAVGPFVLAIVEFLVTDASPRWSLALHPLTGLAIAADTPLSSSLPTPLTVFRVLYADPGQFGGNATAVEEWVVLVAQMVLATALGGLAMWYAARRVTPGRGPRRRAPSTSDAVEPVTPALPPTPAGGLPAGATPPPPPPMDSRP